MLVMTERGGYAAVTQIYVGRGSAVSGPCRVGVRALFEADPPQESRLLRTTRDRSQGRHAVSEDYLSRANELAG